MKTHETREEGRKDRKELQRKEGSKHLRRACGKEERDKEGRMTERMGVK